LGAQHDKVYGVERTNKVEKMVWKILAWAKRKSEKEKVNSVTNNVSPTARN